MTTPLIVVPPVELIDAMLISTDVPEADHSPWSGGTTYALGARCIKTTGVHRIFESLADGNLGHDPETSPTMWVEAGPTNRWAMFDTSNSTSTVAPSGAMTYTISPGSSITALAALNVVGALTIRVRLTHPELGTIYDSTLEVGSLPPEPGWWQWFFGLRTALPQLVVLDLPGIPGCEVTVDFAGTPDLSVGVLLVGAQRAIGLGVLLGAQVELVDYSRKEINEFGDTVLVRRKKAKRGTWLVPILAEHVDASADFFESVRAIPCLWIGNAQFGTLTLFGFYKRCNVTFVARAVSECNLEIEGMT